MNQQPTLSDQPVTIKQSTTPGKLMRDSEALYHVRIEGLPTGFVAQYWMSQNEVEAHVRGGFAAIRRLQQKWLRTVA